MLKKEEILSKINRDVEYIPSLEEYKLIAKEQFYLGESPVFNITLIDSKDKNLMGSIENETSNSRPHGLAELYWQLERDGYCSSYSESNIYYVAYTLAEKKIDFLIGGMEYKIKMKQKIKAIAELKKIINES